MIEHCIFMTAINKPRSNIRGAQHIENDESRPVFPGKSRHNLGAGSTFNPVVHSTPPKPRILQPVPRLEAMDGQPSPAAVGR